jgi:hypothetical protein
MDEGVHNKVHLKAIVLGTVTAVLLSTVAGPLETAFRFGSHLGGLWLHVWSLGLGFVASAAGAYVVARYSPSHPFINVWIYWAATQLVGTVSLSG